MPADGSTGMRAPTPRPPNAADVEQVPGSGGPTLFMPDHLSRFIPDDQWRVYEPVIASARRQGLGFAVGGGLAVSLYTGAWRNTKDLDIYVLPGDRDAMVAMTQRCGMTDYYDELPYDRNWIYRATRGGMIVDVIWAQANGYDPIDALWLSHGPEIRIHGETLRLVPPEEMIWSKLHVLQRDRCDWPDVINIVYAAGPLMDWERLIERLNGALPLLAAALLTFAWVAPGRAGELPGWLWQRLGLQAPPPRDILRDDDHIFRLDSRPWFAPGEIGRAP